MFLEVGGGVVALDLAFRVLPFGGPCGPLGLVWGPGGMHFSIPYQKVHPAWLPGVALWGSEGGWCVGGFPLPPVCFSWLPSVCHRVLSYNICPLPDFVFPCQLFGCYWSSGYPFWKKIDVEEVLKGSKGLA
jgi:hypothetical protein